MSKWEGSMTSKKALRFLYHVQFAICGMVVSQTNLINNPDFETWTGNVPYQWSCSGSSYLSESVSPVYNGSRSVEFLVPVTSTTAELYQDLSIPANAVCTFSCHIYDNTNQGEMGLIINWRNEEGSLGWTPSAHSSDSGLWQELGIADETAPDGATLVRLRIRAYKQSGTGGGTVYVDQARFFMNVSLSVTLTGFTVVSSQEGHWVQWETRSESGISGFHIFRSVSPEGPFDRMTPVLVPVQGTGSSGARYSYLVRDVKNIQKCWYRLDEVTDSNHHNPLDVIPFTHVSNIPIPVRSRFKLNSPNPFNPSTRVHFEIAEEDAGWITLDIMNMKGRRVAILAHGIYSAGQYIIPWSGINQRGVPVPSGIYIARLMSEFGLLDVRKMIRCE